MKITYYLSVALITLSAISCNKSKKDTVMEKQKFEISDLDTTINPGNDFFQYATGGWNKANPIPAQYSKYGSFNKLEDKNQAQIKGLIEELSKSKHTEGSLEQKIGDLYAIGMDSVKLNSDGANPLTDELKNIESAQSIGDIIRLSGELSQYCSSPFFHLIVGADDKNSSMNIVQLYQGGLGMGERDYYLATDSVSKRLRQGYITLIKKQFINAGYTEDLASKAANDVMEIETALAKSHNTKESTRNPEKNYHKMKVSDLNKQVADFDWKLYFEAIGAKSFDEINVCQLEPISAAIKLIQTTSVDKLQAYLKWRLINSAASYLNDNFAETNFEFYGKLLSGSQEMQPRWKRVVNTVDNALSEAVGQIYVEKYFPAEAKERMLKLVANLQETLGERIKNLSWMSDATKAKAEEKLRTFTVKIGYPDKWIDYTSLDIKKDSYWANIVRANKFEHKRNMDKVNKAVDKTEWLMPPQMVNAYYNPTTNEICFPAGILQPPFFYLNGDDAVNYGGIGVVIGHEMSHGFDDQGSQYDKEGNLANWWTVDDAAKFKEKAQILVNHFNKIEVLPGLHANGEYTLGENIGDFGGLQIAYAAFSKTNEAKSTDKIDGFTPQQRFFLSYAKLWAGNIRNEEIRRLTQVDVHSLGKWRVNGTLPHINAWYDAFNIVDKDSLYIAPSQRADIW